MEEKRLTAEQALAALSFLPDGLLFEREQQRPLDRSCEEKETSKADGERKDARDRVQRLVPDWVAYDDSDDDGRQNETPQPRKDSTQKSIVESLGSDISALVLSHLSVSELSTVSLVSRSMHCACRTEELWRTKFVLRWNYPRHEECSSWFEDYKAAYANPHDLWVTHWNIVAPNDGDSPGRCCISAPKGAKMASVETDCANNVKSPWMRYCPTCRYSSFAHESTLPLMVQQAIDREACVNTKDDPVDEAEVKAGAHSLLLQESDTTLTSHATAVFAATEYAIAKWCRNVRDLPPSRSHAPRACQAFRNAATFHRQIDVDQYKSHSLRFLTDALFFSLVDSHLHQTKQGIEEKQHLAADIYERSAHDVASPGAERTVSSLGPYLETSNHTWHILRFSNPDYVRPLMYRIFVQRPDCFTVYPSEGILKPGGTCHITLGVRLLGSLISEAFEALNVQREEVDPYLADVYAHEAHLPYAPFAIRYTFAPVIPCIPPSFTSRGGLKPAQSLARPSLTQAATSKYKQVGEYSWENVATEATVRTLYLSAHVHANYRFEDFQRSTLTPFEIRVRSSDEWGSRSSSSSKPMVFVAPNLLERDSTTHEILENMQNELELSDAGQAHRTEKKCVVCCRDWGARSEDLGRAFILQQLLCDVYARRKDLQMRNLVDIIRHVYLILDAKVAEWNSMDMERVNGLLYIVHGVLVQKRADPVITRAQRQVLLQLESVVDRLCQTVQEDLFGEFESVSIVESDEESENDLEETPESDTAGCLWRNVGVYSFSACTDSVYGPMITLPPSEPALNFIPMLKDELAYLDGFRYLCHNPGLYCLGPQQDPNHEDPPIVRYFDIKSSPISRVIHREQRARNTDVFMDNSTLAFACALSVIHDPRSLLVHGVYDRIYYPGTISRRPTLPPPIFNRVEASRKRNPQALTRRSSCLAKKWKSFSLRKNSTSRHAERLLEKPSRRLDYNGSLLCFQYGELDPESHDLIHLADANREVAIWQHISSLDNYVHNVPPPGVGSFSLAVAERRQDDRVSIQASPCLGRVDTTRTTMHGGRNPGHADIRDPSNVGGEQWQQPNRNQNERGGPHPFAGGNGRGPGMVNFLWLMSAHFGWTVDDTQGAESMLVDRKILIATQWVSNSLMALPLLWTLLARSVKWITSRPVDYYLDGLPYEVDSELRYLSATECGAAALFVFALWFVMGRFAERRIGRSFERSMMEHLSNEDGQRPKNRFLNRTASRSCVWCQRQWDRIAPLFLQRLVFTPRWNRRGDSDALKHVSAWRSKDLREHRSKFDAEAGQGVPSHGASVEDGGPPIDFKDHSPNKKLFAGLLVSLGSFSASSPHFFLNLLTVFSCSIALGMSMSLQSMEVGRRTSSSSTSTRSIFKPLGLNTVVIGFFLIGQLVGSSGGVLFLAEFVVMSTSILLGGAGTISARAMESWGCFFCLSSTAFWGYLFARVALIDGIRHKRRRPSSVVLCACLIAISGLWLASLWMWKWEMPPCLMIVRPRRRSKKYFVHHLQ